MKAELEAKAKSLQDVEAAMKREALHSEAGKKRAEALLQQLADAEKSRIEASNALGDAQRSSAIEANLLEEQTAERLRQFKIDATKLREELDVWKREAGSSLRSFRESEVDR